jgi:hypothetical protein
LDIDHKIADAEFELRRSCFEITGRLADYGLENGTYFERVLLEFKNFEFKAK